MTRELGRVPVCEMSDEHLVNTLAMIKRNAEQDQENDVEGSWRVALASSDIAAHDGGDAAENLSRAHWTRWGHRMWAPMFKDALRRGGDVARRAVEIL